MFMRALGVYCPLLAFLALMTSSTWAQTPLRRYRPPAGPTITPYLDYYRADLSTLPSPYRSFVVPQQQMRRDLYDLARTQQEDFRKIETGLKQIQSSKAAPTGVGASFQNYSHYFPSAGGGGRRR